MGSEGKREQDPADVAKQGFQALRDDKDHEFAVSLKTKIEGEVSGFAPPSVTAEMHRKPAERKQG